MPDNRLGFFANFLFDGSRRLMVRSDVRPIGKGYAQGQVSVFRLLKKCLPDTEFRPAIEKLD